MEAGKRGVGAKQKGERFSFCLPYGSRSMEAGKGGVGAKPKGERESRKGGKRERERER